VTGWAVAALLFVVALRLRRRLELVARAEHELRGPLTAFGLVLARVDAPALDAELERAKTALGDLTAARRGRRAAARPRAVDLRRLVQSSSAAWGARVDWRAGPARVVADEGRLAQALGNLLANAAEHGDGAVTVRAQRSGSRVAVRVVNPERGRGLSIAEEAARDAGARLSLERASGEFGATLELPSAG
jgi:signal transduction histidine kinase